MPGSFAHLHVHTEYSMLDGAARVDDLFAEAARMGVPTLAIVADHGQLFGAVDFYMAGPAPRGQANHRLLAGWPGDHHRRAA